jgi:hypothetical protein
MTARVGFPVEAMGVFPMPHVHQVLYIMDPDCSFPVAKAEVLQLQYHISIHPHITVLMHRGYFIFSHTYPNTIHLSLSTVITESFECWSDQSAV